MSEIFEAVQNNDLQRVRRLLDADASLADAIDGEYPVLAIAAGRGHVDVMQALLSAGADPNAKSRLDGSTAMHVAALFGPMPPVDCLLANGADVNARDALGQTPLHLAAVMGRADACRSLLGSGAEADARDCDGLTPLHRASARGSRQVVEILAAGNADVDAKDGNGNSPLHASVFVDVQFRDYGETETYTGRVRKGMERLVRGAAARRRAAAEDHAASVLADWEPDRAGVAEVLIAAGADVNATNNDGLTPLHHAMIRPNYEEFQPFVSELPRTDDGSIDQRYLGHPEVMRVLTAGGADPNARFPDGLPPLLLAVSAGKEEMVEILLSGGADANAKEDCTDMALAAASGIDPRTTSAMGRAALHLAIDNPCTRILEMLLNHGADPGAKDCISYTPLHKAACKGNLDAACALVTGGAEIDARDHIQGTPLHAAALEGHTEFCRMLLAAGAEVDAEDQSGMTPLQLAMSREHTETAQLLQEHGADPKSRVQIPFSIAHQCRVSCSRSVELECACGRVQNATVWSSINAAADPALKEALFVQEINVLSCPKCGGRYEIAEPLLYHDPETRLLVQLWPRPNEEFPVDLASNVIIGAIGSDSIRTEDDDSGNITPAYGLRMASSRTELLEKIQLSDEGLDDRAIELLKRLAQTEARYPAHEDGTSLVFHGIEHSASEPRICLLCPDGGVLLVPADAYSICEELAAQLDRPFDRGLLRYVNEEYAERLLSSAEAAQSGVVGKLEEARSLLAETIRVSPDRAENVLALQKCTEYLAILVPDEVREEARGYIEQISTVLQGLAVIWEPILDVATGRLQSGLPVSDRALCLRSLLWRSDDVGPAGVEAEAEMNHLIRMVFLMGALGRFFSSENPQRTEDKVIDLRAVLRTTLALAPVAHVTAQRLEGRRDLERLLFNPILQAAVDSWLSIAGIGWLKGRTCRRYFLNLFWVGAFLASTYDMATLGRDFTLGLGTSESD